MYTDTDYGIVGYRKMVFGSPNRNSFSEIVTMPLLFTVLFNPCLTMIIFLNESSILRRDFFPVFLFHRRKECMQIGCSISDFPEISLFTEDFEIKTSELSGFGSVRGIIQLKIFTIFAKIFT